MILKKIFVLIIILFSFIFYMSAAAGDIEWEFLTGDSIRSSPVIDSNGIIYVGSDDNKLYAINPDGTKKWEFDASGTPVIGNNGTIYAGSYAINPDGTKKWKLEVGGTPAIGLDNTIYTGYRDLYAINPDGTKKWCYDMGGAHITTSLIIGENGTIYFGTATGKILAIN